MIKPGLVGLAVAALGAGCGDDGGGSGGGTDAPGSIDSPVVADAPVDVSGSGVFTVTGTVGTGAPATGRTVVLWVVSSGSPDYIYKYGEGGSSGAQFVASFAAVPPTAAINSYGVGIGIVALLPAGAVLPPDGMVDDRVIDGAGYTPDHGIIYKAPGASAVPWIGPFPEGYSCGRCVRASSGFDSFEPTTCSTVEIDMTPMDACNWT